MDNTEAKVRHELKYVVSAAQIPLLKSRITPMMRADPHAGVSGTYSVRSLYFDDHDCSCFYDNENGEDPREKLRLRIYNRSPDLIHLECKRKERGKTLKTTVEITREQAQRAIEGAGWTDMESLAPLLRKMKLQMDTRLLRPAVIVDYDRTPFVYAHGNVRVTFDMNVSSSSSVCGFFQPEIPKRPIMPVGWHLLEVKYDEFLPDFIYRALNLGSLQQTAYSKYYLCRRYRP